MTHLHEEARSYAASQVLVVLGAVEVSAEQGQGELAHDTGQLVPHAVSALQRPVVDEVLIAPFLLLIRLRIPMNASVNKEEVVRKKF